MGHAPVKVLHCEGVAHRPMGAGFDPLPPQAVISILKLESKKMPIDLLIIDRAEKVPAEN